MLQYVTTAATSPEGCDAVHYRHPPNQLVCAAVHYRPPKPPAVCAAVHNRSSQSPAVCAAVRFLHLTYVELTV